MSKKLELTRRRLLGGLGTIGVASAGAGLGTSAYLNDTEEFENNMLTAGTLDLAVDYVVHEDQGMAGSYTINSIAGTKNGNAANVPTLNGAGTTMTQTVDDVKPGDSGYSRFCFTIDDNPAYLWACGELTDSSENGYTEPEPVDDNGEGELEESIEVEITYCELDDQTGELLQKNDVIFTGTLAEALIELQTGIPLDGTGDGSAAAGNQSPYAGTGEDDVPSEVTNPCICVEWVVPTDVGNEIQGDSITFDLSFHAIQARHNDGTSNPCVDETYTADYDNSGDINQPIPGGVLRLDVAYGDQMVVYDIFFDEPDGSQYSLADPDFASSNFAMPFDADDDGIYDFQVAWDAQDNDDFSYSGVTGAPDWEKDTGTGWSALPAGIHASKSGAHATIAVRRELLDAGGDDSYIFGFHASAGGEQPNVSIPDSGPYSSNDNWTSSENGQGSTLQ